MLGTLKSTPPYAFRAGSMIKHREGKQFRVLYLCEMWIFIQVGFRGV
jgi:hypothetical protein